MAERGITLTRDEPVFVQDILRRDGWRVRITATDAVLMPAEIFLHRRNIINALTQETVDEFCAIASIISLSEVPVDDPAPTTYPPFLRKSVIDVLVPSSAMAIQLWEDVKREVTELIAVMDRMDQLETAETHRCGAALEESSSE